MSEKDFVIYSKDQCAPLSSVGTGNTSTLTECLHKKQLNFTRFKYEFNIPWGLSFGGSMTVRPFRADARINGKLYISKSLNLIMCEITALGNYAQPTIVVGKCESFAECQLKFESPWPFSFSETAFLQFYNFNPLKNVLHQQDSVQ
ncbi:unnamed protein product [Allacma fusca]|uniref:Uncharacterized protein n=1 Tax=Allacma fusca TaxID=39272 RepID=A0A8J2JLH5_9HEXA|nr:unnamed protein product [Allacma fusca]